MVNHVLSTVLSGFHACIKMFLSLLSIFIIINLMKNVKFMHSCHSGLQKVHRNWLSWPGLHRTVQPRPGHEAGSLSPD